MTTQKERPSLFESKSHMRAQKIVDENISIADRYEETQPVTSSLNINANLVNTLSDKSRQKKQAHSFYIENRVNSFLVEFGKITKSNKSEVLNELMLVLISETDVMSKLTEGNEKIQKLIEGFNE